MSRYVRNGTFAALVLALLLVASACTSEGGGAQEGQEPAGDAADTDGGDEQAAEGTGGGDVTIAMVTHAPPGDTFWDFVRNGAVAAAEELNVNLQYSNDPQPGNQANLVQNAIDQNVDGIAVTLAFPEAMTDAVQSAMDAGIPVVAINAGLDQWRDIGVQMYFGQDESIAGAAGGERLNEEGAEHVMCVIQEQGHVALEARCDGVEDSFGGQTTTLYVQGQDLTSVESSITAQLQQDPSIDTVMTLGAPIALTALQSVESAGSEATVVTFDTNDELLQAIVDGRVPWAIDQQPFVQGFMGVQALWMNIQHGASIGGGEAVLTGPAFIDEGNIDAIIEQ